MPSPIASRIDPGCKGRPRNSIVPLSGGTTPQPPGRRRSPPTAELAREAKYLAFAKLERYRSRQTGGHYVATRKERSIQSFRSGPETFARRRRPSMCSIRSLISQRFDLDGLEAAAIAKDGDPIRDLENLSQAMSYVNDRSTFAGEFAHNRLDLLDLNVGQRGGRLIENGIRVLRDKRRAISTSCCWAYRLPAGTDGESIPCRRGRGTV